MLTNLTFWITVILRVLSGDELFALLGGAIQLD